MDFKAFPKIESLRKVEMTITQKIHGTNAQVMIFEVIEQSGFQPEGNSYVEVDGKTYFIRAGSRSRWIYPGDDNYGFAAFVDQHKEEFIRKLGIGQHFGEWAGPGINSGEGLTQKVFVLFDWWKYPTERELPPQTTVVPLLYKGPFDLDAIEQTMNDLKTNGSKLAPGFMRPEGVVVNVLGTRLKKVFDAEETQWKKPSVVKAEKVVGPDVSHLFQPVRLEKLLSRDEAYLRNYPKSLAQICSDYVSDLVSEGEIKGDADQQKAIRKAMGGQLFGFVKEFINERNLS